MFFNNLLIKMISWHLSKILQPSPHSRLVSTSLYWMWFKQNLTLTFLYNTLQRNSHHSFPSVLYTTLEIHSLKKKKVSWLNTLRLQLRWLLKLFFAWFPLSCRHFSVPGLQDSLHLVTLLFCANHIFQFYVIPIFH